MLEQVLKMIPDMLPISSAEQEVHDQLLPIAKTFMTGTTSVSQLPVKDIVIKSLTHCARNWESFESAFNRALNDNQFFTAIIDTELELTLNKIAEMSSDLAQELRRRTSRATWASTALDTLFRLDSTIKMEIQIQVYRLTSLLWPRVNSNNQLEKRMQETRQFFEKVVTIWREVYPGINLRNMPPFSFEYSLFKDEKVLRAVDCWTMISQWPAHPELSPNILGSFKTLVSGGQPENWYIKMGNTPTHVMTPMLTFMDNFVRKDMTMKSSALAKSLWEASAILYRIDDHLLGSLMSGSMKGTIEHRWGFYIESAKEAQKTQDSLSDTERRTILPFAQAVLDRAEKHPQIYGTRSS
ncbi:hypothetical protein CROQUDRAFT_726564 [Cronartium quercuum f. sp. fusiforme G11]|uniref:Uncharacterized protein n=1 Tax=Cronartium quercuum f. sp. fusiforme G11 TaxID=708437 RepID=A0A9P6T6J9_9BASI|nr:hypothetical protein CROQUDRAFT_726564 [Cronartium quercuum f. sp. fusiforme G11]